MAAAQQAEFLRRRGDELLESGRAQEAVAAYRRSLSLQSDLAEVHYKLGIALSDLGQVDEALSSYRNALSCRPAYPEALNNLGLLLQGRNHLDEAIASYRRAIECAPALPQAHVNLGNAFAIQGRLADALPEYREAIALRSDYVEAYVNLGSAQTALGDAEGAVQTFRSALAIRPDAEACNGLGVALGNLGRIREAIAAYRDAVALSPAFAGAHYNLASLLHLQGRFDEAISGYREALRLDPALARAQVDLGNAYKDTGEIAQAVRCYREALRIEPGFAEARWAEAMSKLSAIFEPGISPAACREEFANALAGLEAWHRRTAIADASRLVGNQLPFLLAYQEADNKEILSRHGRICSELMTDWFRHRYPPAPGPRPSAAIRIGIVSRYICDHSVWHAIVKGWMMQLDRRRFELHLFHLGTAIDAQTDVARRQAASLVHGTRNAGQWVDLIRDLQPDALIYPEIGMDPMAMKLASLRLAPVQACSWGHPETTGLPTIDYYLSAEDFEPEGAQAHYTERLVPLPKLGCFYPAMNVDPEEPDLESLGIDARAPILLCPGIPYKYAPQNDHVFVDIARALGRCRLVFFDAIPRELSVNLHRRLRGAFAEGGLSYDDFVVRIPWQAPRAFRGLMRRADVYLDTIGFSGFNTAMQAVESGIPIVAKQGRYMRGRFASGILSRMGLDGLAAASKKEYVALAAKLATDAAYRREIKLRMQQSKHALFSDPASITALSEFLADAVQRTRRA